MIYAERVGNSIETNAGYRDKERMRSIPGSRFNTPPPTWTVPLTWAACLQLRGTFGPELEIGPNLRAWADEQRARVDHAASLRERIDEVALPLPTPAGTRLLPFQTVDVLWMLVCGSGLLMNPTGSGKTPVTLTWMRNLALERVLVICPKGKKLDWVDEARTWYPELPATAANGTAAERRNAIADAGEYGGLVAVGMEAARTHSRLAPYGQVRLTEAEKTEKVINEYEWDAVIVDEGHRLADPKSKQTRACWAAGRGAEFRWALTATPTTKGIDTLWGSLHFSVPEEHPSRSKFVDRYATVTTNFWGGVTVGAVRPEMEPEFQAVIAPRTRHLPKEVVMPFLPKVQPKTRLVPMSKEQRQAYEQMADRCLAEVAGQDVVVATSTAAQYTRLGQLASSFARVEVGPDGAPSVELCLPSSKIDALLEDLEDWVAQEESVAVFATSRRLLDLTSEVLTKRRIGHSVVKGGQKEIERYEEIERFQRGEVPVILVVMKAGGESLNLTKARIGAFIQRSWARWEDEQAEGRYCRYGSEVYDSLMRVDYIAPDTVEVGQLDVLAEKEDISQQVLRDKELIAKMVTGDRLRKGKLTRHPAEGEGEAA